MHHGDEQSEGDRDGSDDPSEERPFTAPSDPEIEAVRNVLVHDHRYLRLSEHVPKDTVFAGAASVLERLTKSVVRHRDDALLRIERTIELEDALHPFDGVSSLTESQDVFGERRLDCLVFFEWDRDVEQRVEVEIRVWHACSFSLFVS